MEKENHFIMLPPCTDDCAMSAQLHLIFMQFSMNLVNGLPASSNCGNCSCLTPLLFYWRLWWLLNCPLGQKAFALAGRKWIAVTFFCYLERLHYQQGWAMQNK